MTGKREVPPFRKYLTKACCVTVFLVLAPEGSKSEERKTLSS
jgi:hypothetical protein